MYRKSVQKESEFLVMHAYCELFNAALRNQVHPQDLLLLDQHAALVEFNGQMQEMHGLLDDGLNSMSHINFVSLSKDKYLVEDNYSFQSINPYSSEGISLSYQNSIHEEKLIYLKIWENIYFLKQLTQLINLANGKPYDWELKIKVDGKHKKSDHIRNHIKEKMQKVAPQLYSIINDVYSQQIRNAIAHSQYSFIQNGIKYDNYKSDKYATIEAIGMTDWEKRYTLTVSLFCSFFIALRAFHENYAKTTLANDNQIEVKGSKLHGNKIYIWEYFEIGDRWIGKRQIHK